MEEEIVSWIYGFLCALIEMKWNKYGADKKEKVKRNIDLKGEIFMLLNFP